MVTDTGVSALEQRQAVEAALKSRTFARSVQLRALLQYICDRELAGHPEDLTEYQIAVNVLGRAKDYNLSDDSAVRNRAYELRQRLEKLYHEEQADAEIRIEVPRGSYVPQFVRQPTAATEILAPRTAPATGRFVSKEGTGRRSPRLRFFVALSVGMALLLAGWVAGERAGRPSPSKVIQEAWGPLLRPGEELLVSIAINLHMIVRPHIGAQEGRLPVPAEARSFYGEVRPLDPGTPLFMQPAQFSVPFGEMAAIANLCGLQRRFGAACQILPEAEAPVTALRGRNAVLIGSGTNSKAARILLRDLRWSIDYGPDETIVVLDHREAKPPAGNSDGNQFGLLTVLGGAGADERAQRTLIISGVSSAGIQAAVEFFTSEQQMQAMKERFLREGQSGFPPVYQVLIRYRASGVRLLSYEYAADAVGYLKTR